MSNLDWVLRQQEGQFFERKSCFDRLKGKLHPLRAVAQDVAKTAAAMENVDGGALVLGVEAPIEPQVLGPMHEPCC